MVACYSLHLLNIIARKKMFEKKMLKLLVDNVCTDSVLWSVIL